MNDAEFCSKKQNAGMLRCCVRIIDQMPATEQFVAAATIQRGVESVERVEVIDLWPRCFPMVNFSR